MAVKQRNNSQKKKRRGKGKPFVKGDPRINRKGRPKDHDALREFIQQIGAEELPDGRNKANRLYLKIRQMYESHDARDNNNLIEHGWGKVKEEVEHSGAIAGLQAQVIITIPDNGRDPNSTPSGSAD